MMFKCLFANSLWVRPIVMMIALASLTAQSVQAQSSSTWSGIVDVLAENVSQSGRPAGGGGVGGDIIVFDIVDSVVVSRVMLLGESVFPGVYEVLVDTGDSIEPGLMWEQALPLKDGKPKAAVLTIRLTIVF